MSLEMFNELQEELKQDQMKALWEKHGSTLILLCVAVVVGTGIGVAWKDYKASRNATLTGQLMQALSLKDDKAKHAALEAFAAKESGQPQAVLARLHLGAMDAADNPKAALAEYKAAAESGGADAGLQNLSRMLAANVAAGSGLESPVSAVKPGAPFYDEWREADAWQIYAKGRHEDALARFGAMKDDVDVPATIRNRMQVVTSFLSPEASAVPEKASGSTD